MSKHVLEGVILRTVGYPAYFVRCIFQFLIRTTKYAIAPLGRLHRTSFGRRPTYPAETATCVKAFLRGLR